MNKVSQYLQGHISGDVSTRLDIRSAIARDSGVLSIKPDMVVYPRNTNDVRKIARFASQLAEKKHPLAIITRGNGTDTTGSSVGRGTVVTLSRYMCDVAEYDSKQKLVRVQAGASIRSLQAALALHNATIPALDSYDIGTIGGAVANDSSSRLSPVFGSVRDWTQQLEVVLDNGEVLQTGRISRRELDKMKGTAGRIGDIYRGVDAVLEEHAELIEVMREEGLTDKSGYPGIVDVVGKHGTCDLMPLFVGSQGTLGIVVEMIMRATTLASHPAVAAAVFKTTNAARDAADDIAKLNPTVLEYYDGAFVKAAVDTGKAVSWLNDAKALGASLEIELHESSEHKKRSFLKKLSKILKKHDCIFVTSQDNEVDDILISQRSVELVAVPPEHNDRAAPLVVPGFSINLQRFEEFSKDLLTLSENLDIALPLHGSLISGIFSVRPTLALQKTTDKQKLMKLLDQLTVLVANYDGSLVSNGGEGRLLSRFARASWTEDYEKMMNAIKQVFDPHGVLNPGVKSQVELRELALMLRSDNAPSNV